VLVNLIDNAAKYGGSPVKVSAESTNGQVRIAVSDAGPGIAQADRDRIFEKFYRAGPQLTRSSGGTGLGLYISRELAQRMGGRLHLASEPGQGATFVVELPRP
jgi:two-component system sensor histidine kinase SenX3